MGTRIEIMERTEVGSQRGALLFRYARSKLFMISKSYGSHSHPCAGQLNHVCSDFVTEGEDVNQDEDHRRKKLTCLEVLPSVQVERAVWHVPAPFQFSELW